ncbi:TetR/AcrR family transcriptional regulator [Azospirillum isscasi]|uniref:TetR/AcrR family transcriptional regulator n=1 Tax=Azospirillum isscasi TaxID=3053926 RepID=A0ABU0WE22_9PROT|nr:TetR/AcrR family transcriptional regulator [Azospirillum isscasi]MDQ2102448.1 TetR/AcrR family transcriptional regulator [Azospirillum isscasi]
MPDKGASTPFRDGTAALGTGGMGAGSMDTPGFGPRGQARCRALLDAAAALFVEKGFALTSLSDILRQAGGSRTTLYEHFGDKEGLFRAVMERHCDRVLEEMSAMRANGPAAMAEELEENLFRVGLHVAGTLTVPETTAILRILVSEGGRIPDIAQAFFQVGPEKTVGWLAGCFRDLAEAGRLRIDDPEAAAHAFLGMMVGDLLTKRLILPNEAVSMEELERYVRQSVRLFLAGTRP